LSTPALAVPSFSIGGITVQNTRNLITADTKICMMIYAVAKRGKTTFGKTLDDLCKKYFGKPALFIALEPTEGGGTMSIQDSDVDFVAPRTYEEYNKIAAALASDTKYGGVIVDSSSEYVSRFLKPYALKFPYERGNPPATRQAGVPAQNDYQTMGEQLRLDFNKLIALTTVADLNVRKHLLVTALEKEKFSRDGKELISVHPDLPGAMAGVATSMFQTVGSIDLRTNVVSDPANPKATRRVTTRYLCTDASEENKRVVGDRTKLIPTGAPLDFVEIYEKYWIPKLKGEK
jgi:hypothetical protein